MIDKSVLRERGHRRIHDGGDYWRSAALARRPADLLIDVPWIDQALATRPSCVSTTAGNGEVGLAALPAKAGRCAK